MKSIKVTSAGANKILKKLQDEKSFLLSQERENNTYVCADTETPVVPDYDYAGVKERLSQIDDAVVKIKHAINIVNTSNVINVEGTEMSIDEVLIRMAQLNQRKNTLDLMRKTQKKSRVGSRIGSNSMIEYRYANYDVSLAQADYNEIDNRITSMQLALDKFNQTFEFDIEVDL